MQDSKFSCLVFVRVEKERFGDANFSGGGGGGELILIGQFFAVGSPVALVQQLLSTTWKMSDTCPDTIIAQGKLTTNFS